jgi:hypothetical protein
MVRSALGILTLACAAWSVTAGAALRVGLEPTVIDELGTTRLTIRASGTNQAETLDLSALEQDFDVLGTQSASQYRAVNGRVEAWVEYQISLRPRRSGTLTVPSITVGGETTSPVELTVQPVDPDIREAIDRMVYFETTLSANPVYVQAETVLTRRLYYSSGAQIYSDLPGIPDIEHAVVTPLGETRSSTTVIDGQRYGVVEQQFAIFPEQSGTLTIPSISVTSSVRLERNGRTRRSGVRVSTEALVLDVLPIPPQWPADVPWLPAQQVTIADRWSPDETAVTVGDPITREVRIQITGNVASAIPAIAPDAEPDGLRQYPEPPDLGDDTTSATVIGTRTQRYALIPTQPGATRIPELAINWWDVNTDTVRTATAEPRLLRVTGAAASAAAGAPAGQSGLPESDTTTAADDADGLLTASEDATDPTARSLITVGGWLAAALALLLAVVGFAGWLVTARRLRRSTTSEPVAARARTPDQELKSRRRRLQAACRDGDPADIHRALLAFLASHYRVSPGAAAERFRAAGHGPLLDQLNARLYGPAAEAAGGRFDAAPLLRALDAIEQPHDAEGHRDPLPPLYG